MSLIGNLVNKVANSKVVGSILDSKIGQGLAGNIPAPKPSQQSQLDQAQRNFDARLPQRQAGNPMGAQAKSVASKPVVNKLPPNQVKPAAISTPPSQPVAQPQQQQGQQNNGLYGQMINSAPQQQNQQPYTANNGLYGQLVTGIANQSQGQDVQIARNSAQQLQNMGTSSNDIDIARSNLAKQIGIDTDAQNAIRSQAIPLEFQQGRAQVLQQAQQQKEGQLQGLLQNLLTQRSQQQSALSSAGNLGLSTQSQNQNALSTAAGLAKPQFVDYGSAQFDPVTGTYKTAGGGTYGSGPQAGVNVQSIQEAQSKANAIAQDLPFIDQQFSAIANLARQAHLTDNVPLASELAHLFGKNWITNPQLSGFTQALQSLNQKLQANGEAPINPENATIKQIEQAQQAVRNSLNGKKSSYEQFINSFNNGNGSKSNSSGSYTSNTGNTYSLPY